MELIAAVICLSARAKSHPTLPLNPSDQHHVREVLCDQKAARLWLAQFLHHPLQRPARAALSDSLRICTMGGSTPNLSPRPPA